ncbi:hypothetical protein ANCCEY_00769 [Ancylostoma ceylanicum]|uniref:Uncharacterized protein n=1 Tax=Ancylostoma ceylanicum TaxID=53326 RepID=A0A0D6M7S4_9BILA|nr:hypothetical protein ANCCEY_00769 [Ancylostoma ceylanicum]
MSCQQRCTQVTTVVEKEQSTVMQAHVGTTGQCTAACSPKCAPQCIQDQQLLLEQQAPVAGPANLNPLQEQQLLSPSLTGPLPQQLPGQQPSVTPGTIAEQEAAAYAPYPEGPTFIPLNAGSPSLQELLMADPTLAAGPLATGTQPYQPWLGLPSQISGPLPSGGAYPEELGVPAFITNPAGLAQSPQLLAGQPALAAGVPQPQQGLAGQQIQIPGQYPAGALQPELGLAGQPSVITGLATADAGKEQSVLDQSALPDASQQVQQGLAGQATLIPSELSGLSQSQAGLANQATPIPSQFPSSPAGLSQPQEGLIGQATSIPGHLPAGPAGLFHPQEDLTGQPSLISAPSGLGQQPLFPGQPSFAEGMPQGLLGAQPSLTSGPIAAGIGQPTQMLPGRAALSYKDFYNLSKAL